MDVGTFASRDIEHEQCQTGEPLSLPRLFLKQRFNTVTFLDNLGARPHLPETCNGCWIGNESFTFRTIVASLPRTAAGGACGNVCFARRG